MTGRLFLRSGRFYADGMRLLLPALALFAASAAAQDGGMLPRWEVAEIGEKVEASVADAKQVLSEVRPEDWIAQGAPQAYVEQRQALEQELRNVELAARALARDPESISIVVDSVLWLDRLNSILDSLAAAVRRYQSAPMADLLESVRGRNAAAAGDLKEYMRQLAVEVEQRMAISHEEAQRCRSTLMKRR